MDNGIKTTAATLNQLFDKAIESYMKHCHRGSISAHREQKKDISLFVLLSRFSVEIIFLLSK